jgi:glutathione S-transferase
MPLVSLASKKIYGRDVLDGIDVKGYLKVCAERPAVKKVDDDRRAAQAAAKK